MHRARLVALGQPTHRRAAATAAPGAVDDLRQRAAGTHACLHTAASARRARSTSSSGTLPSGAHGSMRSAYSASQRTTLPMPAEIRWSSRTSPIGCVAAREGPRALDRDGDAGRRRAGRARGCAGRGGGRCARDRAAPAPGRRTARRRARRREGEPGARGVPRHGSPRGRRATRRSSAGGSGGRARCRARRAGASPWPRPTRARGRRSPRRGRRAIHAGAERIHGVPTSGARRSAASSSVWPSGRASAFRAASGAGGRR